MALGRIHDSPVAGLPDPLRLVVAGEFSSGKSTAINAVLRHRLLPSAFGGLKAPPIRVRHGAELAVSYPALDGSLRPADSILDAIETGVATEIHVTAPFPALRGVELIEVPARPDGVWDDEARGLVASADMLIWCTISSQAWRLSEKAFIEDLPRSLRSRSVLLLSRADKLRSNADCDKIMRRLEREAATYFANVIFMGGAPDLIEASSRDETAWADTGGKYILDLAQELFGARGEASAAPFPSVDSPALPKQVPEIDRKVTPAAPSALHLSGTAQGIAALDMPRQEISGTDLAARNRPGQPDTEPAPARPGSDAGLTTTPDPVLVVEFKPHLRDAARQSPDLPEESPQAAFLRSAHRPTEADPAAAPAPAPASVPAAGPADATRLMSELDGMLAAGVAQTMTGALLRVYSGIESEVRDLGITAALLVSAQARAMQLLRQTEPLDEMLINHATTALLIRPLDPGCERFVFTLLARHGSNLPVARTVLRDVALILGENDPRGG